MPDFTAAPLEQGSRARQRMQQQSVRQESDQDNTKGSSPNQERPSLASALSYCTAQGMVSSWQECGCNWCVQELRGNTSFQCTMCVPALAKAFRSFTSEARRCTHTKLVIVMSCYCRKFAERHVCTHRQKEGSCHSDWTSLTCMCSIQALLGAGAVILALVFVITSLGGEGPSSSSRPPPAQQVSLHSCYPTDLGAWSAKAVVC